MRKQERRRWTLARTIKQHIENNIKEYIILSIMFLIGIILGVIFINNLEDIQKSQISEYINTFIECLKTDYTVDAGSLIKTSIINNIILVILIWFMGSTVVGIPIVYGIVIVRGFSLGYTIASAMITLGLWKGMLFNITTLLLQNIIFIPCILALAVSGVKLYKSIMKDRRKENIKVEILRHSVFSIFIGLVLLLSSFIEVYVSTNMMEYIIRWM